VSGVLGRAAPATSHRQAKVTRKQATERSDAARRPGATGRSAALELARGLIHGAGALAGVVWRLLRGLFRVCRILATSRPARWLGRLAGRALAWLGRLSAAAARRLGKALGRHPEPVFGLFLAGLTATVLVFAPNATGFYTPGDKIADLDCLALNIYHEARGEPEDGKLAVGHVVVNRARDPRFPGTLCDVVKQGGESPRHGCQFSWWCDGRSDQPRDWSAWEESRAFADLVYSGTAKDPTGGALWYHADYVDPFWRRSLAEGPKIGRHIFYFPE
jgi:hypothetical protein